MTAQIMIDSTLDLTGLPNPEPINVLREAALAWPPDDTVRVITDDECFVSDFLRWCYGEEVEIISLRYLPRGVTELVLHTPGHERRLSA